MKKVLVEAVEGAIKVAVEKKGVDIKSIQITRTTGGVAWRQHT